MGGFLNQIGSVAGIKLFKGGPYADRELGDAALKQSANLASYGAPMLQQGTEAVKQQQDALMNLLTQLAVMNGVQSPYGPQSGVASNKQRNPTGEGAPATTTDTQQNPFDLTGPFLTDYNSKVGLINKVRQARLSSLKANLAKRGLSSSTIATSEQLLNDMFDTKLQEQLNTSAQTAFGSKNSALAALISSAFNSANVGLNQAQAGAGMLGQQVNTSQNQAAAATDRTNTANQAAGGALGAILGQFTGGANPAPAAGNPLGGFGQPGNIGGIGGPIYGPQVPMGHSTVPMQNPESYGFGAATPGVTPLWWGGRG